MEQGKKVFKILTGKTKENSPLGRPRRRWEGNIRMNLKEIDVSIIRLRMGIVNINFKANIEPKNYEHGEWRKLHDKKFRNFTWYNQDD